MESSEALWSEAITNYLWVTKHCGCPHISRIWPTEFRLDRASIGLIWNHLIEPVNYFKGSYHQIEKRCPVRAKNLRKRAGKDGPVPRRNRVTWPHWAVRTHLWLSHKMHQSLLHHDWNQVKRLRRPLDDYRWVYLGQAGFWKNEKLRRIWANARSEIFVGKRNFRSYSYSY